MSGKFVCSCGHVARDNYNLIRHRRTHESIACKACGATFAQEEEAKAHKATCDKYCICAYCYRRLSQKKNLAEHIKKQHGETSADTTSKRHPRAKPCPLCSACFTFRDAIDLHLSRDHQKPLVKKFLVFDTEEGFYKWKAELESSTRSAFTQSEQSVRKKINYRAIYWNCFRSGLHKTKPVESRKRHPRMLGSNKMNAYCPARINAKFLENGKTEVTCVLTHVGHDFEVSRLRLSKSYREYLALQMKLKIPIDEILSREREKALESRSGLPDRNHFLTRQDLYNIARDFRLHDVVSHQSAEQACSERTGEPSESNPSIIVESPTDDVFQCSSDNIGVDQTVEYILSESPSPTVDQSLVEELTVQFHGILSRIKTEAQYAVVKEGLSSIDAALSALE